MIKAFLIAAVSADGFIAQDAQQSSFKWTSPEDKKRFIELTKRAGVVVMGSTTYATLPHPLKDRVNIVYSHSKTFEGAESTQKSPEELLKELESRGFKEAALCGGSHIYSMFMDAGLVDRIYLTIEPVLFGKGITLFNGPLTCRLKLENSSTTPTGTVLLEYSVIHT